MAQINVGDIYEDCAYHPVRCTFSDGEDVKGISMVDGSSPRTCSIRHCGVTKLTEDEANKLLAVWQNGGEKDVLRYKGWTEAEIDELIHRWR